MPSTFSMTRRVAFAETDAAGIVHFANFFRYMEDTEHAFLRSLGLAVHRSTAQGVEGFPRVSATCEYQAPLHFEEQFDITLSVRGKTNKSLTYHFAFTRHDDQQAVASGKLTVVYVTKPDADSPYRAAALPPEFDDAIQIAE